MYWNGVSRRRILVAGILSAMLLVGCAGGSTETPTPTTALEPTQPATEEISDEPSPTVAVEPTAETNTQEVFESQEAAENAVIEAVLNRDRDRIAALTGSPFTITWWGADSMEFTPEGAADELAFGWLLPGNPVGVFTPSLTYETALLGGTDPLTLWGGDVQAVSAIFSTGWGSNGFSQALLIIAEGDGGFYWHAVLVAPEGFSGAPDQDGTPTPEAFAISVMRAIIERRYDIMPGLMGDSFTMGTWLAERTAWQPDEAAQMLQDTYMPPMGSNVVFDTRTNLEQLLGSSPGEVFGENASFIYSTGWGADGRGEAVLLLSETDEGVPYWVGIVFALEGF